MKNPFPLKLALMVEDQRWPDEATLTALAETALQAAFAVADEDLPAHTEVSLVFTNDENIKRLNNDWREKDKATNVLSFPAMSEDEWDMVDELPEILLGDIILAYETIEREAIEAEKTFDNHLSHLLIHGFLHLLGYDHEEATMAEEMEALEILALAKIDIENPYEETELLT